MASHWEPRDTHPLLAYFGALCNPMDRAQSAAAGFDERMASIGRFVVREVLRFHHKMSPEGKVNYDPEDIILEVWLELRHRDARYDAAKGNYRTFSNRIMQNTFNEISSRARPVRLPWDAAKLFAAARQGDMTMAQREKWKYLSAASRDAYSLDYRGNERSGATEDENAARDEVFSARADLRRDVGKSPLDDLLSAEEREQLCTDISEVLDDLDTIECLALGSIMTFGGESRRPLRDLSDEYGIEFAVLRRAMKTAKAKVLAMVQRRRESE